MIFIPFNHQPFSVAVKTASYTIPAGYYARSVVECDSGGTFTIDAVTAVSTSGFALIDAQGPTPSYTTPSGYRSSIDTFNTGSAPTITINGNAAANGAATVTSLSNGPAGTVSLLNGNSATSSITGVSIPSNATHRNDVFWLPTGTVINGTGNWKAVVELYPMIS